MRKKCDYSAEIGTKALKSVNYDDNYIIAVLEQYSRMLFVNRAGLLQLWLRI